MQSTNEPKAGNLFQQWAGLRPVIGMIHLPPLPGAPGFGGDVPAVFAAVRRDLDELIAGGVHGIMMENFGDVPFFPGRVPAQVVAMMTSLACDVRSRTDLPLGINVLRNDGQSALAVAHACGAAFVRVNVLCGARVTDQGVINGIAHDLLRERAALGAENVRIMADVDVKHSAPLAARPIEDEVEDTLYRGLADAVIVSGAGTGKSTSVEKVKAVKAAAGRSPVFIGSGITAGTIRQYLPFADGFIVGTAFKRDGDPRNPVERQRVRELIDGLQR
jgi:membrane complex biogenesis BtpA family protein